VSILAVRLSACGGSRLEQGGSVDGDGPDVAIAGPQSGVRYEQTTSIGARYARYAEQHTQSSKRGTFSQTLWADVREKAWNGFVAPEGLLGCLAVSSSQDFSFFPLSATSRPGGLPERAAGMRRAVCEGGGVDDSDALWRRVRKK
jgi:hypothetical protein